jgi:hypothetical protein
MRAASVAGSGAPRVDRLAVAEVRDSDGHADLNLEHFGNRHNPPRAVFELDRRLRSLHLDHCSAKPLHGRSL